MEGRRPLTLQKMNGFGWCNLERVCKMQGDTVVASDGDVASTKETLSEAIVRLEEEGTEAGRELLVSYTTDDNRQIAAAAKMALEKMDARS